MPFTKCYNSRATKTSDHKHKTLNPQPPTPPPTPQPLTPPTLLPAAAPSHSHTLHPRCHLCSACCRAKKDQKRRPVAWCDAKSPNYNETAPNPKLQNPKPQTPNPNPQTPNPNLVILKIMHIQTRTRHPRVILNAAHVTLHTARIIRSPPPCNLQLHDSSARGGEGGGGC